MTALLKFIFIGFLVSSCAGQRRKQQRPTGPTALEQKIQTQQSHRQTESASECPEPFGFFADAEQCDKYYQCEDGVAKEKLCPDGLVFLEAGSSIEKCEFPFAVDCSGRPKLQPSQPALNCPRKNGYFAHENEKICDKFFFCVDGSYNAITCPAGLVFNNATGTCTWPDQAKKNYCSSGELFDFTCPATGDLGEAIHPRYADPKDCQAFYVCIDGKIPRKGGCSVGTVFNEQSGQCDKPKNVPECKDWYKGILDYDEDGEIATTPRTKPVVAATETRRKNKRPRPSQT